MCIRDRLWRGTVAPAIAWAQAPRHSIAKPERAAFSFKDLCSMWREVKREGLSWVKPTAPIRQDRTTLERIGWKAVSPLDWVDDEQ
eukprot:4959654-Pyramimonas_sp.AAC.1